MPVIRNQTNIQQVMSPGPSSRRRVLSSIPYRI